MQSQLSFTAIQLDFADLQHCGKIRCGNSAATVPTAAFSTYQQQLVSCC